MWRIVIGSKTRLVTPQLQVDWDKRDGKARANILFHLKDFQLFLINDLKTSKEMWDGLCSIDLVIERLKTLSNDDSAMALLGTLFKSSEGFVVSLRGQNVLILRIVIGFLL